METIIIGAGSHGKVVLDVLKAQGIAVKGFLDGTKKETFCGLPILGIEEDVTKMYQEGVTHFIVAIGDNTLRESFFKKGVDAGLIPITTIHPSAVISESVHIGKGTVIMAGAIINADSQIGDNVIINTRASIDHDNKVGDHVHICPGVTTGGLVNIGKSTFIGIGSSLIHNITIGSGTIIGGGATVVKDMPDHVLAVGVPAKPIKEIKKV